MTAPETGRRVVIVGGGGGIGSRTAEVMAVGPTRIALIDRNEETLSAVCARLAAMGVDVMALTADAAERADMERAFAAIDERWGGLDVLVHAAGLSGRRWGDGPIDRCTPEGWEVVMRNNLDAVYLSNQLATQRMLRQEAGCIVNLSSVLGLVGDREHFATHAYAASRGAVIALSRSMAAYYARRHIRVNCVCPGLLDTPMSHRAMGDPVIQEALTRLQPLPPHHGYPEDVAQAIAFLASDAARFITGVVLPVDGGWSAQ